MIVTSRCARWLQSLPDGDAAALLDAVARCAADPLANPRHCKHVGRDVYECRVSLPPSRQFRLMFSYRRDGVPVLLAACLKTSLSTHEKAVRAARRALSSDEPKEIAMAHNPPIFSGLLGWIYASDGRQYRVRHMTRKKVLIETAAGLVTLNRSKLEQIGCDTVDGITFRTSRYVLPIDMELSA